MYNMRDVDEIAIFDMKLQKKLDPNLELAKDISENRFVPITLAEYK